MDGSGAKKAGSFWVSIITLSLVISNQAAAYTLDPVNTEWHSTARNLAMGNAGIANTDDAATGMFYNPAGLAISRKMIVEAFSPQFEMSTGNFAMGGLRDISKLAYLNKAYPLLNEKRNKGVHFGFAVYPNFSARNFSFGILLDGQVGAYVNSAGKLYYHSQTLFIPTLGLTMGIWSGVIKLGAAFRAIQATYANSQATTTAELTNLSYTGGSRQGFGFGVDAGMMIVLPVATLPSFGYVVRNIGDTALSMSPLIAVGTPPSRGGGSMKMMHDGGFSISPKLGQRAVLKFAADYRDILDASKVSALRKVNIGFELGMGRKVFLRWGVGQGFWTAGFGLSGKNAGLDLTTYGEELHPSGFRQYEDRRLVLRYGGKF